MANEILEIRFGVAGGASVDGESGRLIARDLTKLAQNIHSKVSFRIDKSQAAISSLQSDLNQIAKGLKLNVEAKITGATQGTSGTGGSGRSSGGRTSSGKTDSKKSESDLAALRNTRAALNAYKSTTTQILNLKKRISAIDADNHETQLLQQKIDLLENYLSKLESVIRASKSAAGIAEMTATKQAADAKEQQNEYDALVKRAKEYEAVQKRLSQVLPAQNSAKYTNTITGLTQIDDANSKSAAKTAYAKQYKDDYEAAERAYTKFATLLSQPMPDTLDGARAYLADLKTQADAAQVAMQKFNETAAASQEILKNNKHGINNDKAFANATKSAEQFYSKYKDLISANDEFSQKWSALLQKLNSGGFNSAPEAFAAISKLQTETIQAGLTMETFGQRLKRLFGDRLVGIITAFGAHALRRSIREIYNNVVQLDDALTEFSIVSGKAGRDLDDFADRAFEAAKRIRAGVTDVIDAATVYNRLGFSDSDSLKYAELTAMYSKVGDVEISDAESNITALIKAYNVGADQLELALDKMVFVGNNFAISAAEIGQGMNNAASSLAANGNTLEQSIALLTAAQIVTQDAAKSSTALRTISARLTNSKAELDALGESTDDLAGSTAKYREELLALTGVDIKDQNGQFKSTYEILKAIAGQWEKISKAGNKEAVATLVAGTRQQPVFYSIMEHFQEAIDAMDGMQTAGGTMSNAYGTYIDSITGHIENLKTTFAEFSQDVLDSDVVKFFIDLATTVVKVVDALTKAKTLVPTLMAFGLSKMYKGQGTFLNLNAGAKQTFKDDGFARGMKSMFDASTLGNIVLIFRKYNKEAQSAVGFTEQIHTGMRGMAGYSASVESYITSLGKHGKASMGGYVLSLVKAKVGTIALRAATLALNAAITMGLSFAISKLAEVVVNFVNHQRDAIKAGAEAAEEFQREKESLAGLVEQYQKLYEENGGTWNADTLKSIKDIQEQITASVGHQVDGLDLVNGKLSSQLEILRGISVENAKAWDRENKDQVYNAKQYLEKNRSSIIAPGGPWASKPGAQWIHNNIAKYGFSGTGNGAYQIQGTSDEIIDAYQRLYDALDQYARQNGIADLVEEDLARISDAMNQVANDTYTAAKSTYQQWLENEAVIRQSDILTKGFADQKAFNEYIVGVQSMTDVSQDLRDAMIAVVKEAFPDFVTAEDEVAAAQPKATSALEALIAKIRELRDVNNELAESGNVDLTNRPQVQVDGAVQTVFSGNQEYRIGAAGAEQNIIVHYTPILPDGTVLSEKSVSEYLQGLIDTSETAAEVLSNDANQKGIILKIDTGLEYDLDDSEIEKIWEIVGDRVEQLQSLYTNGNAGSIRQALMGAFLGTGIDLDQVVKYLSSIFGASQWDENLHNAQEELYSLEYAAYGSGNSVEDLISKSEALKKVFDGMTTPEVLELLLSSDNGSAKNITAYLDAADAITKMQQQLSNAQSQVLSDGSISADTAAEIYKTLSNAQKDYTDYLTVEGDKIKLNTAAYQEFIREQAIEQSGVSALTKELAEQIALREEIAALEPLQDAWNNNPQGRTVALGERITRLRELKEELASREEENGDVEYLQKTIDYLEVMFDSMVEKTGIEGLGDALDKVAEKAYPLEKALNAIRTSGNLDELTETDFSNLISAFPKLKRVLTEYRNGTISATRLTNEFQAALDSFDASNEYSKLSSAKSDIEALASVYNEFRSDGTVSFEALTKIQEAFGNVDGIDTYIQKLKEAKGNTEETANVIGTLLYKALINNLGSVQALADADEDLIAKMLKEAGVANSVAAAHQAVEAARRDSSIAAKVVAATSTDDVNALIQEAQASGITGQAMYDLIARELIFNNTNLDVSQKIKALGMLTTAANVSNNAILNAVSSLNGASQRDNARTIAGLVQTGQAKSVQEAEQLLLSKALATNVTINNPFEDVDFTATGGGSSATKADQIKESFDALNSSLEHAIYLQQQYYTQADRKHDTDAMKASLEKQVEYYKQIQTAAHAAAEQMRAYYRSQGLSAAAIENQSDIQELQKTWWNAANSINDTLDKLATAIRDKLSKQIDDVQSAWSNLQKAAEEYSNTGTISVDSLQAIINAGVEYVALLKDENGQLVLNEDAVSSVLEAKTEQLAVESALGYIEQVRTALTQKNTNELARLLDVTQTSVNSTWDLVYAQAALLNLNGNQYNQLITNINKFRSIATTAVKSVRKQISTSVSGASTDYKSALDDVLKYVMDLIKYEHEQMVDALNDQKDAYQAIIDKKKEMLQQTQDEEDYESNVSKKLKEISKLQDQINRLSLDDSREAAAKRASLEEELAGLQEELADYIGDYSSTKNEEVLDKASEKYGEYIDGRIQQVEDEVSSEEKLYRLAISRINSDWQNLYQQILDWNLAAGNSLESEIIEKWNLAAEAVQRYGGFVNAVNATKNSNSLGDSLSYDYSQTGEDPASIAAANSIVEKMKANAAAWHGASKSTQSRLNAENLSLAQQLAQYVGSVPVRKNGVWYLNGQELFKLYPKYHEGGIVGGLPNQKQQELLTVLKNGELVATEQMQKRAIELVDFAANISKKLAALPYSSGISAMLKNDIIPSIPKTEQVTRNENSSMVFSPEINVVIQSNGKMSDEDASAFGNKIADVALGKLSEAFGKRGIRNFSGILLKA